MAPIAPRVLLARAMRLRCPVCGGADLVESWPRTRDVCPRCGLRLDRGEHDFFTGGYMLNFVAVEVVFALALALVVVASWPDVPWNGLLWGGLVVMLAAPLLLFPFSRTVWLAIDLTFQPLRASDFTDASHPIARAAIGDAPPARGPTGEAPRRESPGRRPAR